jgi:hypothetical protein
MMKRVLLMIAVLIGMSFASSNPAQAGWRHGNGPYYRGPVYYGPKSPYGSYYGQRYYGSYLGYPGYYGYGPGMPNGIGVY